MNKTLRTLLLLLLLLSSSVFAEASIDTQNKENTFLLTAPGTVTGSKNTANNKASKQLNTSSILPTIPKQKHSPNLRPRRYKYVGENTKFRQFGQKPGNNNPWFEEYNRPYPGNLAPMYQPPMTNPWQLGGMPPLQGMQQTQPEYYSSSPPSRYGPNQFSGSDKLYPDFPDGIYRDTNPAALQLPGQNGYMPGMRGDKFGFPFSPFGMF